MAVTSTTSSPVRAASSAASPAPPGRCHSRGDLDHGDGRVRRQALGPALEVHVEQRVADDHQRCPSGVPGGRPPGLGLQIVSEGTGHEGVPTAGGPRARRPPPRTARAPGLRWISCTVAVVGASTGDGLVGHRGQRVRGGAGEGPDGDPGTPARPWRRRAMFGAGAAGGEGDRTSPGRPSAVHLAGVHLLEAVVVRDRGVRRGVRAQRDGRERRAGRRGIARPARRSGAGPRRRCRRCRRSSSWAPVP